MVYLEGERKGQTVRAGRLKGDADHRSIIVIESYRPAVTVHFRQKVGAETSGRAIQRFRGKPTPLSRISIKRVPSFFTPVETPMATFPLP